MEQPGAALGAERLARLDRRGGRLDCPGPGFRRARLALGRQARGGRRRLGGRRGRRQDGLGVVDVEVRLDGGAEFLAGAPQFPHRPPHHASQLRELRGTEDQEGDDADDDHLLEADVEHRPKSNTPGGRSTATGAGTAWPGAGRGASIPAGDAPQVAQSWAGWTPGAPPAEPPTRGGGGPDRFPRRTQAAPRWSATSATGGSDSMGSSGRPQAPNLPGRPGKAVASLAHARRS